MCCYLHLINKKRIRVFKGMGIREHDLPTVRSSKPTASK